MLFKKMGGFQGRWFWSRNIKSSSPATKAAIAKNASGIAKPKACERIGKPTESFKVIKK